jgi:hypothetical protein
LLLYARAVGLFPQRLRFSAALWTARALQPLVRRTSVYAARKKLKTDGVRATSLDLVLSALTRYGTRFEPVMTFSGLELLEGVDARCPSLFVGPHTMLSHLIYRRAHDCGLAATGISSTPFRISGTRKEAPALIPSRTMLVRARDVFAGGGTIFAFIDRKGKERRCQTVVTSRGNFLISTALLEIAVRQRVRVVFMAVTVDEQWRVMASLEKPAQDSSTTIEVLLHQFGGFIDRHVGDDAVQ